MASVEWARSPSKESPASFVLFCKLTRSKATTADITNTEKAIFKLNEYANVTPKSAEWDKVSPKYDNLLQITKHPSGPATIAIPTPAQVHE